MHPVALARVDDKKTIRTENKSNVAAMICCASLVSECVQSES